MALQHPLTTFGTTRLIEDVFAIPGQLIFDEKRLVEVRLNQLHPYAPMVACALQILLRRFAIP